MAQAGLAQGRTPDFPFEVANDPANWGKEDLAQSSDWLCALVPDEIADLKAAVKNILRKQTPLINLTRNDFPLPILGPLLLRTKEQILEGRGIALLRGIPVDEFSPAESIAAFLGIGCHLGMPVSQNGKGHILGHVKDLGDKSFDKPTDRGYQTHDKLPFHSDSCDVVGLLCLHHAKRGGASTVVSTVRIYNEMLKRAPELVRALAEPIYRDRRGEIPEGGKPHYPLPVLNWCDGYLSIFWQGGYIRSAQRFEALPRHSPDLLAALDMFGSLARELAFHMDFQRGDIQFLNNHVTVHSRTEYEDFDEAERKRHLLRLWLATPDGRPLPPAIFERYPNLPKSERPSGGIIIPGTALKVPMDAE